MNSWSSTLNIGGFGSLGPNGGIFSFIVKLNLDMKMKWNEIKKGKEKENLYVESSFLTHAKKSMKGSWSQLNN